MHVCASEVAASKDKRLSWQRILGEEDLGRSSTLKYLPCHFRKLGRRRSFRRDAFDLQECLRERFESTGMGSNLILNQFKNPIQHVSLTRQFIHRIIIFSYYVFNWMFRSYLWNWICFHSICKCIIICIVTVKKYNRKQKKEREREREKEICFLK